MSDTAGYDVLCMDQWKCRLDMDQPCGMVSFEETCWLCDNLTAWNRAMSALGLTLEEPRPGTLRLRCLLDAEADVERVTTTRQASFLASWLLCHHPCIQEVTLSRSGRVNPPVEEPPFQIYLRPQLSTVASRRLRSLHLRDIIIARLELIGLEAVIGLETLDIKVDEIDQHFADKIDVLMEHNRATLKKVGIWEVSNTRCRLAMVESLVACERLALCSNVMEGRMPEMDAMVHLMRVSTTLKEVIAKPLYQADLSLIAEALETNRTLTKLLLYAEDCASIVNLFRSLELNNNLEDLSLCGFVRFNAQAVASAVMNNSRLRSLYIEVSVGEEGNIRHLSEALSQNSTLHSLTLHYAGISMSEVSALCKALRVNKTLKTLQLEVMNSTPEERTFLARQLLADDCYDRVRLRGWGWTPDLSQHPVTSSGIFAEQRRRDLYARYCYLEVAVKQEPDARVALLCEALKKNRHIKRLRMWIENVDSANEIFRALTVNAAVTFLDITLRVAANEETMEAFSDMLSRNKAITGMSVRLKRKNAEQFLDSVARAMSRNRLIVSFMNYWKLRDHVPSSILESVRRNQCSLNRAVEFVLQRRDDRRGAECFELFVRNPLYDDPPDESCRNSGCGCTA
ncbi:hypothetical protein MTO96_008341 [Rhipicephalus appendiculatus]